MNKNLILSSHMASPISSNMTSNEFASFDSSAELKWMEDTFNRLAEKLRKTVTSIKQPLEWLRKYYSIVLEKEVSMKQTTLLLETQFAFLMAIFPADIHLLLRAASLCWFCYCLHKCKRSL